MASHTKEQAASREKTLLAAVLLSAWAPFTTGIAVLMSSSITQLADFIRRTVELAALIVSWQVFRYIHRSNEISSEQKSRLERMAGISVAAAMAISGLVMLVLSYWRILYYQPGGRVTLGLVIAVLGFITNSWFWRRYTRMARENFDPLIDSQSQLYRAKSFVDLCVIAALSAVAINPAHIATRYIDSLGSLAVSAYLIWSAARTARSSVRNSMNDMAMKGLSSPKSEPGSPLTKKHTPN